MLASSRCYAFADYHELVSHPEIDLVTVAVRVPWHREMVLAAVNAGKHVYCEWPLGSNLQEVEEMTEAARVAGVAAMPGLQGREAPWVLHVNSAVLGRHPQLAGAQRHREAESSSLLP